MDVSGVFLCTLCTQTLNFVDKKVELACNHTFHTQCFIVYTSHHEVECPVCRVNLFTDEIHELGNVRYRVDREEREKKIYKELTETPGFVDNLKVFRKQLMCTKKAYANFKKIGTLARRGFRTETAALRAILQSMRKTGIKKLRDSSELKELRRQNKALTRATRVFQEKYTMYTINEISRIPQFKLVMKHYYWSRYYLVERYFRAYGL